MTWFWAPIIYNVILFVVAHKQLKPRRLFKIRDQLNQRQMPEIESCKGSPRKLFASLVRYCFVPIDANFRHLFTVQIKQTKSPLFSFRIHLDVYWFYNLAIKADLKEFL